MFFKYYLIQIKDSLAEASESQFKFFNIKNIKNNSS